MSDISSQPLSEKELDAIAGAGDPVLDQTLAGAGAIIGGQVLPAGTGGSIGTGVGTGVAIAIQGGSANESIAGGAMAAAEAQQETGNKVKEFINTITSGW